MFWPTYLADTDGYFKDNGVDLKVTTFQSGSEAAQAFAARNATFLETGDVPGVSFVTNTPGVTGLGQISVNDGMALVVSTDIKQPSDLAGMTLAVAEGSSSNFWLDEYLQKNGLEGKVKLKSLDPPSQAPALLRGDIDGAVMFPSQAYVLLQQAKNMHEMATFRSMQLISVRTDFLKQHRDAVVGAMKALAKSAQTITNDPNTAVDAVAGQHGVIKEAYEQNLKNPALKANFNLEFPKVSYDQLERQAKWLDSKKQLKNKYDFCKSFDLSVMKEVVPNADIYNPCQ
jgi:NitT/TauT family transport system substrate-binding protein